MAVNPTTVGAAMAGVQAVSTIFAEKGRVKALKKDTEVKQRNNNLSQAAVIKAMQETFLTQVHDFNNAYAVSMGEIRNNYEDVEAQRNLDSIGMNGTSYSSYSKSIMDTQYQDLIMNTMTTHKENYSRMNKMNANQMENTLNKFGQTRLDNVNALYSGIKQIHAETGQAIISAATQGAVAGYEHAHSGTLPTTPAKPTATPTPTTTEEPTETLTSKVANFLNPFSSTRTFTGGQK